MTQPPASLPDHIVDEAITWLIRLDIDASDTPANPLFERWLKQSAQHQLAWERVAEIRHSFTSLPQQTVASTLTTFEERSAHVRLNRRQTLKVLSCMAAVVGTGWLARDHTPWQRLLADYSTTTGEQRTFTLTDGSTLILNTDSAVSTDLAGRVRKLNLRRGEIQISSHTDIGHTPKRPLLLHTHAGRIQVQDAQFTVRLQRDRARVSVQQGDVKLFNPRGDSQHASHGDSFWLSRKGVVPAAASVISPDAWVSGVISGQNIPLGELLDELSRYRNGIIDYAPELAELPVSGIFHLKDTDSTLNFIAQVQPVRVEFHTPYWVVVRPA